MFVEKGSLKVVETRYQGCGNRLPPESGEGGWMSVNPWLGLGRSPQVRTGWGLEGV